MDYKHILYEPGTVARVILNRPQYYNAQSVLMREEMDDAFARAIADDAVRVIVLSGAGEHFSAGHDAGTPEDVADRARRGMSDTAQHRYEMLRAITLEDSLRWRNLPKPTIAMVQGYCIWGGWMFAAAMDIVFAADDAKFLAGPVQYFSIPWDIGARKAKELLFQSRFITAEEALACGFVNRVVPGERLEEETLEYAREVAENDPMLLRMMKLSVNNALDTMGFTAAVESGFQTFVAGVEPVLLAGQSGRGFAPVELAKKHTKWLRKKGT